MASVIIFQLNRCAMQFVKPRARIATFQSPECEYVYWKVYGDGVAIYHRLLDVALYKWYFKQRELKVRRDESIPFVEMIK